VQSRCRYSIAPAAHERQHPTEAEAYARLPLVTDETELLDFDELVATLSAWAGNRATVLVGPTKPPDRGPGMVWARMVGELYTSNEGRSWGPTAPEDPKRDGVAFQIGDNEQNYIVLYRQFFKKAWWVSQKHGFLIVEMTNIQIGISIAG
jgi:hypothetical protein